VNVLSGNEKGEQQALDGCTQAGGQEQPLPCRHRTEEAAWRGSEVWARGGHQGPAGRPQSECLPMFLALLWLLVSGEAFAAEIKTKMLLLLLMGMRWFREMP